MKLTRSYTAKIDANAEKTSIIISMLETLQEVSNFVFEGGPDYWYNFKTMYHDCREKFPTLNSKILQNFLQLYRPIKDRTLPEKPIKPNIVLNQNFNIKYQKDTVFTNYWLRFGRRNYPLRGEGTFARIKDISLIKECRIYKKNGSIYCKMTQVEEVEKPTSTDNPIGIDINVKRTVSSDNKFYSMKKYIHRKLEYRKHKQKCKKHNKYKKEHHLDNFKNDFFHNKANKIIADLVRKGSKVLILEDLTDLRDSSSKKKDTSKGEDVNYQINNCMPFRYLQTILENKCSNLGIKVKYINPAYTSKSCSHCGSQNTQRPTQSRFICEDCNTKLDADLNAARNIRDRYTSPNGPPVNLALPAL